MQTWLSKISKFHSNEIPMTEHSWPMSYLLEIFALEFSTKFSNPLVLFYFPKIFVTFNFQKCHNIVLLTPSAQNCAKIAKKAKETNNGNVSRHR